MDSSKIKFKDKRETKNKKPAIPKKRPFEVEESKILSERSHSPSSKILRDVPNLQNSKSPASKDEEQPVTSPSETLMQVRSPPTKRQRVQVESVEDISGNGTNQQNGIVSDDFAAVLTTVQTSSSHILTRNGLFPQTSEAAALRTTATNIATGHRIMTRSQAALTSLVVNNPLDGDSSTDVSSTQNGTGLRRILTRSQAASGPPIVINLDHLLGRSRANNRNRSNRNARETGTATRVVKKPTKKQQWFMNFSVEYKYTNLPNASERDPEKCYICFSELEEQEVVRRLNCMHLYHAKCIDPWIWKRKTCPTCRFFFK